MLVLQSGDSRRKKWNKKFCWCKAITFLKEKKHPIYHQPGGFRVVCAEFNGSITGKNDFYERWWIDAVWWKKILTLRKNRWNIVIFVLARNEKHFKLKPSNIPKFLAGWRTVWTKIQQFYTYSPLDEINI